MKNQEVGKRKRNGYIHDAQIEKGNVDEWMNITFFVKLDKKDKRSQREKHDIMLMGEKVGFYKKGDRKQ